MTYIDKKLLVCPLGEREICARNFMNITLLVDFWVSGNTAVKGRTNNVQSATISIILWKDEPLQAKELRAKLSCLFVPFAFYYFGVCICNFLTLFLFWCLYLYSPWIFVYWCIVFVLQEDSGFRLHLDNGGRKWVVGSGGSGAGLWLPLGQDLMIISLVINEMITMITTKMITKITLRSKCEWSQR